MRKIREKSANQVLACFACKAKLNAMLKVNVKTNPASDKC